MTARQHGRDCVSQVLRLTLLAPEIVEAILDGRQPLELQLDDLLQVSQHCWIEQVRAVVAGRGDVLCYRDRKAQLVVSKG